MIHARSGEETRREREVVEVRSLPGFWTRGLSSHLFQSCATSARRSGGPRAPRARPSRAPAFGSSLFQRKTASKAASKRSPDSPDSPSLPPSRCVPAALKGGLVTSKDKSCPGLSATTFFQLHPSIDPERRARCPPYLVWQLAALRSARAFPACPAAIDPLRAAQPLSRGSHITILYLAELTLFSRKLCTARLGLSVACIRFGQGGYGRLRLAQVHQDILRETATPQRGELIWALRTPVLHQQKVRRRKLLGDLRASAPQPAAALPPLAEALAALSLWLWHRRREPEHWKASSAAPEHVLATPLAESLSHVPVGREVVPILSQSSLDALIICTVQPSATNLLEICGILRHHIWHNVDARIMPRAKEHDHASVATATACDP